MWSILNVPLPTSTCWPTGILLFKDFKIEVENDCWMDSIKFCRIYSAFAQETESNVYWGRNNKCCHQCASGTTRLDWSQQSQLGCLHPSKWWNWFINQRFPGNHLHTYALLSALSLTSKNKQTKSLSSFPPPPGAGSLKHSSQNIFCWVLLTNFASVGTRVDWRPRCGDGVSGRNHLKMSTSPTI